MSNLDDLIALKSVNLDADFAAVTLMINGEFDSKIAELNKVKADMEARFKVTKTLEEAEQIKHLNELDADRISNAMAKITERTVELSAKADAIEAVKNELAQQRAKVDQALVSIQNREAQLAASTAQNDVNLKEREEKLVKERQALDREKNDLQAQKDQFNAKLEKLRA